MTPLFLDLINPITDSPWHIWAVYVIIIGGLVLYLMDKVVIEFTSLLIIISLMVLFHFAPITYQNEAGMIKTVESASFLTGFANPALITILGLLVMGEGLERAGVFDTIFAKMYQAKIGPKIIMLALPLLLLLVLSAFLNNTPLVIILIPVFRKMAFRVKAAPSAYMMGISYAAILGGMTTLIGSSTNLLVSEELYAIGLDRLDFFSQTKIGAVVALVGFIYVVFIMPYLLPHNKAVADNQRGNAKPFKAQLTVKEGSKFIGMKAKGGALPKIKNATILSITRGDKVYGSPFDNITLQENDILVFSAQRAQILNLLKDDQDSLHLDGHDGDDLTGGNTPRWTRGVQSLAEVIIPRQSVLLGKTLKQLQFRFRYHCVVLGIERRQDLLRDKLLETPIREGDGLLIQGQRADIDALRNHRDVVLLDWATEIVASKDVMLKALAIFLGVMLLITTNTIPTPAAAMGGALLMVAVGILSLVEAVRAIDHRIMLMIAAALAMGHGLEVSGGAELIASVVGESLQGLSKPMVISLLFLIIALTTNILSNNATAVLFTPIAVKLGISLDIPVEPIIMAVIIAANCSFATPIGYQTNLLVMGPGGYKGKNFLIAGLPLVLVCWITASLWLNFVYDL